MTVRPYVKDKVARGAAVAFALSVAGAALGAGSHWVLARVLGASEYGIYAYALAWISVLCMIGTLGFTTGLLRFVASYAEHGQWALVRAVIRHAERRSVITSMAMVAAVVAIVVLMQERLAYSLVLTFFVGAALVPADALLQIRASAVRALGRIGAAFAPSLVLRPFLIATGVGILGLVSTPSAAQAMAVSLFAVLTCLTIVTLSLRRVGLPMPTVAPAEAPKDWDRAALPLLLMDGQVLLLTSTDILMLGALTDTTTAGIYAVATRIALLAAFPLRAINAVFAPNISALYARGNIADLQQMVNQTTLWSAGVTLCIILPLAFLADWVLSLFGPVFSEGWAALLILLTSKFIRSAAGSVHMLITMTGNERRAVKLYAAVALVNIALNAALIPFFGIDGAAAATAISTLAECGGLALLVHLNVGIKPGLLSLFKKRTANE